MTEQVHFPTLDEIRTRAYQIYLSRGSGSGHDIDDWVQAEYELMQLPLHKIAKLEAKAIEGKNYRLFNLARAALTLTKQSSNQQDLIRNPPSVPRTSSMPSPL